MNELLPSYVSALNRVEVIWNHTHYADLARFIPGAPSILRKW